ncbi:MAG: chloride channel protein [Thiolinea sp.]
MPLINTDLSQAIYRLIIITLMACVIGVLVSLAALGFIELVFWLNDVLFISPRSRIQLNHPLLLALLTVLVPTLGGLAVGHLLHYVSPEKRPLGPADSIRAAQLHQPLPTLRAGFVSTLAAILSLGCGASVGQYGPMVYLGSIGGAISEKLITPLRIHIPNLSVIVIASGVAAAISTAFNAPIAGLVFAHEVILRHYSLQSFAPTTIAAATGYIVANVIFTGEPLFLVEFSAVNFSHEFFLFALLGICCAVLAMLFMKLILYFAGYAANMRLAAPYRPALAGFAVGLIALGLPDILGVGNEVLRFATIEGAFSQQELVLIILSKLVLTALCAGFGFAGGVFSPSLLIGILFGVLFWSVLEMLGVPNSGLVVYAICGMIALTSPVIGAPLTTILIIFELTRNYELTIAAMVGVVLSNLLVYRLFGRSLFDVQLAKKGIDLSLGRDRVMLSHVQVNDYLDQHYLCLDAETPKETIIDIMTREQYSEAMVLNTQQQYLGMVRLRDAYQYATATPAREIMNTDWPVFNDKTSIWQAMRSLGNFVGNTIPVINNEGKLSGIITEAELIKAYLEIVHQLRREENAAV